MAKNTSPRRKLHPGEETMLPDDDAELVERLKRDGLTFRHDSQSPWIGDIELSEPWDRIDALEIPEFAEVLSVILARMQRELIDLRSTLPVDHNCYLDKKQAKAARRALQTVREKKEAEQLTQARRRR